MRATSLLQCFVEVFEGKGRSYLHCPLQHWPEARNNMAILIASKALQRYFTL